MWKSLKQTDWKRQHGGDRDHERPRQFQKRKKKKYRKLREWHTSWKQNRMLKKLFIDEKRKLEMVTEMNPIDGLEIEVKEIVQKDWKKIKRWKTGEKKIWENHKTVQEVQHPNNRSSGKKEQLVERSTDLTDWKNAMITEYNRWKQTHNWKSLWNLEYRGTGKIIEVPGEKINKVRHRTSRIRTVAAFWQQHWETACNKAMSSNFWGKLIVNLDFPVQDRQFIKWHSRMKAISDMWSVNVSLRDPFSIGNRKLGATEMRECKGSFIRTNTGPQQRVDGTKVRYPRIMTGSATRTSHPDRTSRPRARHMKAVTTAPGFNSGSCWRVCFLKQWSKTRERIQHRRKGKGKF